MSEEILNEAVAEAPLSQDYHDYLNEDGQIEGLFWDGLPECAREGGYQQ